MSREKRKVYIYTRVSTSMVAFNQMMEDIKTGKDEVVFVLVFKLSRFGRNAADVLASFQVMQDFGVNLICVEDGIHKIQRQNGKNPLFDAALIRRIIRNSVYCGKIAYGRRKTEKVHGTRSDYHLVEQDNYFLVDGIHEAIISEEVWEQAQIKVAVQAKKYEKANSVKGEKIHLLSGMLKCPVCGAGMYGNKSIKSRKDGTRYKDYFYYGCKHRNMTRGISAIIRSRLTRKC